MKTDRQLTCRECNTLNEPDALLCARCGASLRSALDSDPFPRRRKVTVKGAILGTILVIVLVVAVFALGQIIYRTAVTKDEVIDPLTGHPGTTATTSTTLVAGAGGGSSTSTTLPRGVLVRPSAASSSSALRAIQTDNYRATNLIDNDLGTAWIEGIPGPGVGEWVRFDFQSPVVLTRLEIINGNRRNAQRFKECIRVHSLKLEYSDGSTQLVELLDTEAPQGVVTKSQPTKWLKMTIMSVHPGYVRDEAALSEVRMFEAASR
ncbi:MAG: NADase-type glycan-binding domain-containing protein [Thermoleophilia bacterium]|jgi:hypothetical protein